MIATVPASYVKRLEAIEQRRAKPAADLADPLILAARCGFMPDPWQARLLTSTARRIAVNGCRQSGKSTTTALIGLHAAMHAAATVLLISPSLRQSGELFRRVLTFYRRLGRPVAAAIENRLSLELVNGGRVISLPGDPDTTRGFTADLLIADEAARIDDAVIEACRPMLAVTGGRLVTLSTPWGRRGWWYAAWDQGGDGWERYKVPATACPRIAPDFLADERRALPSLVYQSEYECRFVEAHGQFFADADIDAAISAAVRPVILGGQHAA